MSDGDEPFVVKLEEFEGDGVLAVLHGGEQGEKFGVVVAFGVGEVEVFG